MKWDDLGCPAPVALHWTGEANRMRSAFCGNRPTWKFVRDGVVMNWCCDDHADMRRNPDAWERIEAAS